MKILVKLIEIFEFLFNFMYSVSKVRSFITVTFKIFEVERISKSE